MANRFVEDFSKQVTASLSLFAYTQEQVEKSANLMLEQSKANLESARKLMNDVWEQSKDNQKQFQNILQEALGNSFSNWKTVTIGHFNDMSTRFDEITTRFEELIKKPESADKP